MIVYSGIVGLDEARRVASSWAAGNGLAYTVFRRRGYGTYCVANKESGKSKGEKDYLASCDEIETVLPAPYRKRTLQRSPSVQ